MGNELKNIRRHMCNLTQQNTCVEGSIILYIMNDHHSTIWKASMR